MKKLIFILWILGLWQMGGIIIPIDARAADLTASEDLIDSSSYLSSVGKERLINSLREAHDRGLPPSEAQMIISRSLNRRVTPEVIHGFLELAEGAYRRQLPVEPILNKIKEGLAKGVDETRIQGVARQLSLQLTMGKEMVDQVVQGGVKISNLKERERLIEAMALAQARDMKPKQIQRIIRASLDRKGQTQPSISQLESAINTAATLKDLGIPTNLSINTVVTALDHHYTRAEWNRLEVLSGKFRQEGIPHQHLLELMKTGVTSGQPPGDTLRKIDRRMQHIGEKGTNSRKTRGGRAIGSGSGRRPGTGGVGKHGR
jgi:hypothetical protein